MASGRPATTPTLAAMSAAWRRVVRRRDIFLDTLATADLESTLAHDARREPATAGNQLQRITYHYWSHIGEASAVRQILGHRGLAQFVGDIDRSRRTVARRSSRVARLVGLPGPSATRQVVVPEEPCRNGPPRPPRLAEVGHLPGVRPAPESFDLTDGLANAMSPAGQTSGRPRTINR